MVFVMRDKRRERAGEEGELLLISAATQREQQMRGEDRGVTL